MYQMWNKTCGLNGFSWLCFKWLFWAGVRRRKKRIILFPQPHLLHPLQRHWGKKRKGGDFDKQSMKSQSSRKRSGFTRLSKALPDPKCTFDLFSFPGYLFQHYVSVWSNYSSLTSSLPSLPPSLLPELFLSTWLLLLFLESKPDVCIYGVFGGN